MTLETYIHHLMTKEKENNTLCSLISSGGGRVEQRDL